MQDDQTKPAQKLPVFVLWLALAAFLWWVLTEQDPRGYGVGAIMILITAWIATRLSTGLNHRLRPAALPGFVAFFLWRSLKAGVDVTFRTLHPALPLNPDMVRFPLQLPEGAPRSLLACTLSLLPGTLSVELEDDQLIIHVLDREQPIALEVLQTRNHIARLFGLPEISAWRT